jgi:hypothetical protein
MDRDNSSRSRLARSAGFISSALFYLLLVLAAPVCCGDAKESRKEIDGAVVKFFKYVNDHSYKEAYGCFCKAIRQDVPFSKFRSRASDILKATLVEKSVYECDEYLAKLKIKARIRIMYQGSCFNALYGGTCDLTREDGRWKVASVSLKALEQKEILDKKPINFSK